MKYLTHAIGEPLLLFKFSIFSFDDSAGGMAKKCFVSKGAHSETLHRHHFVSRFTISLIYSTKDIYTKYSITGKQGANQLIEMSK